MTNAARVRHPCKPLKVLCSITAQSPSCTSQHSAASYAMHCACWAGTANELHKNPAAETLIAAPFKLRTMLRQDVPERAVLTRDWVAGGGAATASGWRPAFCAFSFACSSSNTSCLWSIVCWACCTLPPTCTQDVRMGHPLMLPSRTSIPALGRLSLQPHCRRSALGQQQGSIICSSFQARFL